MGKALFVPSSTSGESLPEASVGLRKTREAFAIFVVLWPRGSMLIPLRSVTLSVMEWKAGVL